MNRVAKIALRQGLRWNQRLVNIANNGFDRIFRSDALIRSGLTPHDIIHDGGLMSVRHYPPPDEDAIELDDGSLMPVTRQQHGVPLVIVPPLAASPQIFDLLPERSVARYFTAKGYRVYLVDWGKPGRNDSHLGFKDYAVDMMAEALAAVREHSGTEPLSLLGWCMGGLFSLLHTGLSSGSPIQNIITIASPVDVHNSGLGGRFIGSLTGPAGVVTRYTGFRLRHVNPKLLWIPGWLNAIGFKLSNPLGSLTSYWDLMVNLWDREFLVSHTTTSDVLDDMLDYPGGIIHDVAIRVALNNELSTGVVRLGDRVSTFADIDSAMLVFAGSSDTIVKPRAAHKSLDLVSSTDKEFVVAPGGHAGVLMGSAAQSQVWALAADWLESRSDCLTAPSVRPHHHRNAGTWP